jgi:hypothetical protein
MSRPSWAYDKLRQRKYLPLTYTFLFFAFELSKLTHIFLMTGPSDLC